MMFDLRNKVVVVVGGRGYLGRDFCQKLRSQNATVISADLPTTSKAATKSEYKNEFEDIDQMDIDVTNRDSVTEVINAIVDKYTKIDSLIYSVTAKPYDFYAPFTECSIEGWQSVIHTELDGLFIVSQEVGCVMENQNYGSMLFISSIYGVVGNDQRIYRGSNLAGLYAESDSEIERDQIYSHSVYPVVKAGIISFTRYLSAYWGDKSIRVNCISPGGVYHKGENEDFLNKYSEKVPLGRKAEVSEVSGAVVYLTSDVAGYITGHNLVIDGGFTSW